jgi:hypothetical protein
MLQRWQTIILIIEKPILFRDRNLDDYRGERLTQGDDIATADVILHREKLTSITHSGKSATPSACRKEPA